MARARKEGVFIILDVGSNMLTSSADDSYFKRVKNCASKIIQQKIFAKSADEIGLILLGSPETKNSLNTNLGGYENINEKINLSLANWQMCRILEHEVQVSENSSADWLDSLIVAMNTFQKEVVTKKFLSLKIILLTNFQNAVNDEQIDSVVSGLKDMNIELIGIHDNNEMETDSSNSRNLFEKILNETHGELCYIGNLEVKLLNLQKKISRPVPWNCSLTIGSKLKIPIRAYIRVQEEKITTTFSTKSTVPNTVTKRVNEYMKGNQVENLDPEEVIKGFNYCENVVPVSNETILEYQNKDKCFSCIGFASKSSIFEEYFTGDSSSIVVPQEDNKKIFMCLIKVMTRRNVCMITRRIYRNGLNPTLYVLIPVYDPIKYSHFIMIQLPFAENTTSFIFSNLRGNKTKPSNEQLETIDKLMDGMNINDEFEPSKTLNILRQHILQSVSLRALNPNSKLTEVKSDLLKMVSTPEEIMTSCTPILDEVEALFELKEVKVPVRRIFPTQIDKSDATDQNAETDFLNDNGNRKNIVKVGTTTPVEDFCILIEKGENFRNVALQIQNVIYDLIFRTNNLQMEKIMESIHIYREQAKLFGPFYYNEWIQQLKDSVIGRNRVDFWENIIVKNNYGLISERESNLSSVTDQLQIEFYKSNLDTVTGNAPSRENDLDDLDDLLE